MTNNDIFEGQIEADDEVGIEVAKELHAMQTVQTKREANNENNTEKTQGNIDEIPESQESPEKAKDVACNEKDLEKRIGMKDLPVHLM